MTQLQRIGKTATSVFTENGITNIVYHKTTVVLFDNEHIVLNTGGWKTATTKNRMNQTSSQFELGFKVYQKDFDWFVDYKGKTHLFDTGYAFVLYRNN